MDDAAPKMNADRALRAPADLAARAADYAGFKRAGAVSADALSFLRQLFADIAAEDVSALSAEDALAAAHEFWTWTERKDASAQIVRVRAGPRGCVLEVAGPDMPFLVRSVLGEVAEQGLRPLAMAHPIVETQRDESGLRGAGAPVRESMIQVHLEPLPPARADALATGVRATLADVRAAVADFHVLKERMRDSADELERANAPGEDEEIGEAAAFLRWLADDHFTFLGARDYEYPRDASGAFERDEPTILVETGLGLLRDPERFVLRRASEPALLAHQLKALLEEPTPLVVAKSSQHSRVHRRVTADYVGVKRYDRSGQVVGERRFVGLFTADAYNEMTRAIPLLRRKVRRVLAASGAAMGSHTYSLLTNILETFPRDELFQIGELELLALAQGVAHLFDRPRPKAFVRRDRFNRFVSALVYLPKERFNSTLREKIGALIADLYGGRVEAFYPLLDENSSLARVHYVIQDIERERPDPDFAKLDADIAALTRTWDDDFAAVLLTDTALSEEQRHALAARFSGAFTAAYRERFDPREALIDIAQIVEAPDSETVRVRAYRRAEDGPDKLRCKIYARAAAIALSASLPILEHMGLYVVSEETLKVSPAGGEPFWIHDVDMRSANGAALDFEKIEWPFEEAFTAIWTGKVESDGFNKLILTLGIGWREAALLRALARYRTQTGLDPAQPIQEQALADHPDIARQILALFSARFDPDPPAPLAERRARAAQAEAAIAAALEKVASLEADRALRRIAALVSAIVRTNYYQRGRDGALKRHMSFKICSPELADLPEPKPYREIWVWSAEVEGVHLRFGAVARGGLRWSDRRDDFRAEVLDLVKAQNVKNSIIVPVGSKGGFFPKRLTRETAPADARAIGVSAYQTFLRGLLDITDDIEGDKIVPPSDVVRWDGDDPYLVVAADKGTASFSDIANAISEQEYDFWLGDAFASGGSAGYDHKAMGITARGAWEAVKRHFREIGKDIQNEPFTVIGVGDMSGDVFGNAMLLSKKIKLIAAFDHRDIFLDPNPADLDAAWAERKRLFDKPGSRWRDYDPKLISPGGGVFARADKAVPLSAEIRALTGLDQDRVTPAELIVALLKARAELLFFGGIGTFIKAARESHADVADKTNDAVRVDAEDVAAQVIGEGANLGVTQAGRIAFARKGGRINTDAIDNSAGVDTSDHEVNIKILLRDAEKTGALPPGARDPLLAAMTGAVAAHVLSHNYSQTLALSLSEATAPADLDAHERFMQRLEAAGHLSRRVEVLPNTAQFADLRARGAGLTRPELAKIIAYAKLDLKSALIACAAPDDPAFEDVLVSYFPPQLAAYEQSMRRHRLRREIIATTLADDIVNIGGPTFIDRARDTAQTAAPAIALAFAAARQLFAIDDLRARIDALDTKAPAQAQLALHLEIAATMRRLALGLAKRKGDVGALIARYQEPVARQRADLARVWTPVEAAASERRADTLIAAGAPSDLAREISLLGRLIPVFDIADLAARRAWPLDAAAALHRAIGGAFGLDTLRASANDIVLGQHWERLALRRTLEQVGDDQLAFTEHAMAHAQPPRTSVDAAWGERAAHAWLAALDDADNATHAAIEDLRAAGPWTFAKVVLAAASLRAFSSSLRRSE